MVEAPSGFPRGFEDHASRTITDMRTVSAIMVAMALAVTAQAESPKLVSFATEDGGKIFAHHYGKSPHAVVLAHGVVFNKESWSPQAQRLAAEGFEVLAIDFRGYGDSAAGSKGGALQLDVLGAIRYLQAQGAEKISVIGGSMGGGAAATAATLAKPGEIDKLVLLAAGSVSNPEKLTGDVLFIVSEGDGVSAAAKEHYKRAPEPKELVLLPGSAHAQHIFKTDQADALIGRIISHLRR